MNEKQLIRQAVVDAPTGLLDAPQPFDPLLPQLTNGMLATWMSMPELQANFDIATQAGRKGLRAWCQNARVRDRGVMGRFELKLDELRALIGIKEGSRERPLIPGANLLGYSRGVLGMGEHVRMSARAMMAADVPCGVVDFSLGLGKRTQKTKREFPIIHGNPHRCNIFHINADQMVRAYWYLGSSFFQSRYSIGYWAWELAECPTVWRPVMALVDEIWAPSRFVQRAFAPFTRKPVKHMPLCVELPNFRCMSRTEFGWESEDFVFCFTMDCHSYVLRKNPLSIIRSFKAAFEPSKRVKLVIKVMNADPADPHWCDLLNEAASDSRIQIIDQTWSRERTLGLISSCDCYVSLHRSEGFGRGPAEAMLLGKPVIVTDYSGTQDYCRNSNSLLVSYQMVDLGPNDYPFSDGQQWAEPNVAEAAKYMRRVFDNRDFARSLGEAGRKTVAQEFSAEAIGRRYKARLVELDMM